MSQGKKKPCLRGKEVTMKKKSYSLPDTHEPSQIKI